MELAAQKLITCIFPKGIALDVAKKLKENYDLMSVDIKSARGIGKITPLGYRGIGSQSEKEILTAIVPEELSNEIFDYIYHEADVNRPHGGLMYIYPLISATRYIVPDLPEEE